MWSHEISALNGQFQQQAMMQTAMAQQMTMGRMPGAQADMLTGMAVNHAQAIGSPILSTAAGLTGLDSPMSGAITGGMFGMALGPVGAVAGAGIGAGMGAIGSVGMGAAQFAAGNFMQGMQQQQGLNMMMRQQYGGMGMTRSQMGQTGAAIREMTHDVMPGGQMLGYEQLQGLASNMGRMGFTQTLTDVRQFSQKFREMIDTLKTVSQDLGTSLENAQQMVVSMRGSGLFQKADQLRMSAQVRQNALSGVSIQETTQMANIGSQISRSIGGLGRQGAVAGARTIGQVGAAQRAGVISEEDIYNVTGLTGSEGRTAYAQQMLSMDARFLRGGLGRRLMASMASENAGEIDEEAFDSFMSGGFSTGETMGQARPRAARLGRASFIRNEGRLRGSLLEKGGGGLALRAFQGWLGSRGMDVYGMDDRAKIFAQRRLGLGREEIDVMTQQLRRMGDVNQFMESQREQDSFQREQISERNRTGVEGMKRSFDQFRHRVQSSIQEVGAKTYNDMSGWVEDQLNRMFGTYSEEIDAQMNEAFASFRSSKGQSFYANQRINQLQTAAGGFGRGINAPTQFSAGFGGGPTDVDAYRAMAQGGSMMGRVQGWLNENTALGMPNAEERTGFRFKYDPSKGGSESEQFRSFKRRVTAANQGARAVIDKSVTASAAAARDQIWSVGFLDKLSKTQGEDKLALIESQIANVPGMGDVNKEIDRLKSEGKRLDAEIENTRDPAKRAALEEKKNGLLARRMNISQSVAAGATGVTSLGFSGKSPFAAMGMAGMSRRDRMSAYGEAMMYGDDAMKRDEQIAGEGVDALALGGAGMLLELGDRLGVFREGKDKAFSAGGWRKAFESTPMGAASPVFSKGLDWLKGATADVRSRLRGGMGRGAMESELAGLITGTEGRGMMATALTGGERQSQALLARVRREMAGEAGKDSARKKMLGIIGAAAEIRKINDPTSRLSKKEKQERLQKVAEDYGFESADEMQNVVNAARDANTMESRREMAKGAQKYGKIAEKKMEEFADLGVVGADGKLSKEFLKSLRQAEQGVLEEPVSGSRAACWGHGGRREGHGRRSVR